MMDKTLRARVALSELEAMGLSLDDLLAAAGRVAVNDRSGPTDRDEDGVDGTGVHCSHRGSEGGEGQD